MRPAPFPPLNWIVYRHHTGYGTRAAWLAEEQETHESFDGGFDDVLTWINDRWSADTDVTLRVIEFDVTAGTARDRTDDALRALARRYAAAADSVDDVPLWLVDYAPDWVREAHELEQSRMYRGAAE